MSLHTEQQKKDLERIERIAGGPDWRTEYARSSFQNDVLWLLCFIAKRVL